MFAALDADRQSPALVISVRRVSPKDVDTNIETATFSCVQSDLPGLPEGETGFVLLLHDSSFVDLFAGLCEEISQAALDAPDAARAVKAIAKCVERWKEFVRRRSMDGLSEEEVRGLIGELAILARLVIRLRPHGALQAWTGPFGSIRDFELPDCAMEVKTYQASVGASVRINLPEQLEPDAARPLYLVAVRLSATPAGLSLPAYADALSSMLDSGTEQREQFHGCLASAGFLPAYAERYATWRYAIEKVEVYHVTQDFPRIAPDMIPGGVERLTYSLRLAAVSRWRQDAASVVGPNQGVWGT